MPVIVKTANQEVLDRAAALLTGIDGGMEKAIKSAMSRAVSGLRSNTVKAIREKYAISAAAIRANENVTVRYTRQDGLQAFIRFAGHKIPLYRYDGARTDAGYGQADSGTNSWKVAPGSSFRSNLWPPAKKYSACPF